MEIKYYLRTLSRSWWLIILTMLLALEVAMVVDYFSTPIYQASARFAVSPNITQLTSSSDILNSLDTLDKRSVVTTYAEFLNSDSIYQQTLKNLNIDINSLKDYTRTTVVITDSNVLELTVEGTDPETTALLANSIGEQSISSITSLYSAYDISLLDPAVPAAVPVRPVPLRDAGLALALGLVAGCGIAILRAQIQTSLDSYRQQNNRDKISEAFNRRYLERRLEQALSRPLGGDLSFGLIQLAGLRGMIDNLPQNMVQDLLRTVTKTFQKELRGNDMICRWDDVTYAILLPTTPEKAAQLTIGRLCAAISQPLYMNAYDEKIDLHPVMSVTTSELEDTATQIITRSQDMLAKKIDQEYSKGAIKNPD